MDLNLFNDQPSADVKSVLQADADKFQKITSILCGKRKALEEKLEQAGAVATDEDKLTLRDLIEEMRSFGISEIDYQKFLVVEAREGR